MPFVIDIQSIKSNPDLAESLIKRAALINLVGNLAEEGNLRNTAAKKARLADNCLRNVQDDIDLVINRLIQFGLNHGAVGRAVDQLRDVKNRLNDPMAPAVNISDVMRPVNSTLANITTGNLPAYTAVKLIQANIITAVRSRRIASAIYENVL